MGSVIFVQNCAFDFFVPQVDIINMAATLLYCINLMLNFQLDLVITVLYLLPGKKEVFT